MECSVNCDNRKIVAKIRLLAMAMIRIAMTPYNTALICLCIKWLLLPPENFNFSQYKHMRFIVRLEAKVNRSQVPDLFRHYSHILKKVSDKKREFGEFLDNPFYLDKKASPLRTDEESQQS